MAVSLDVRQAKSIVVNIGSLPQQIYGLKESAVAVSFDVRQAKSLVVVAYSLPQKTLQKLLLIALELPLAETNSRRPLSYLKQEPFLAPLESALRRTPFLAPSDEGDSPRCGEMSRERQRGRPPSAAVER